mgnify:CR=1 FL=1|tara:strand:- start:2090 stop:2701 length:612 start_codon:yes stop_codon:yes gene_type:complete
MAAAALLATVVRQFAITHVPLGAVVRCMRVNREIRDAIARDRELWIALLARCGQSRWRLRRTVVVPVVPWALPQVIHGAVTMSASGPKLVQPRCVECGAVVRKARRDVEVRRGHTWRACRRCVADVNGYRRELDEPAELGLLEAIGRRVRAACEANGGFRPKQRLLNRVLSVRWIEQKLLELPSRNVCYSAAIVEAAVVEILA